MATGIFGKKAGNAIVPYADATQRTKWIDISSNVSGPDNVRRAQAQFFSDSNDVWYMRFNLKAEYVTGLTSHTITISGVTFNSNWASATLELPISAYGVLEGVTTRNCQVARADTGANTLSFSFDGTADIISTFGTCELDSEPTTYTTAANLENVVDASVYIEPATSVDAGVVGGNNGSAVPTGEIGEVVESACISAATTNGSSSTVTTTNTLSLTAGSWLITYNMSAFISVNPASNNECNLNVKIYNSSDATTLSTLEFAGRVGVDGSGNVQGFSNSQATSSLTTPVNITSSKDFVGQMTTIVTGGGSGQWTSRANSGQLIALRIG